MEVVRNTDSPCRSMREIPPSHFRLKIDSFSFLSNCSMKRFESHEFEAGDYKWKLALYPNGNKKRGGKGYISLYLVLADKNCLNLKKEILVILNLFVFDHITRKYLFLQDQCCFHATKSESGFNKLLSLKDFNDPSKGYLDKDTCVFGAEVFILHEDTLKGQCLSMVPAMYRDPVKFTWHVHEFSKLDKKQLDSCTFTTRGYDWKMTLYPEGDTQTKGQSMALYLALAEPSALQPNEQVLVEYVLRVVDEVTKKHFERGTSYYFSASNDSLGWPDYLELSNLKGSSNYLVNDTCVLETEVIVHGSAKNWE